VDNFIKHFKRLNDGSWACIEPAELKLPEGRIQVTAGARFTKGTKFMGVELASLLDAQYKKINARPDSPNGH
jgi:hypothetical protein